MPKHRTSLQLSVLAILVVACGAPAPAVTPTPPPVAATPILSTPDPGASAPADVPDPALEPWRTATLKDVRSGESFTIAGLAGQVVVMEPMAIWCTNCLRQQREVSTALAALEGEGVVYVSLDVDPSERPEDLAAYADEHGFDWRFVVAGRDLSRMLAQDLGDQVLSPPSTPKIIVTPNGMVIGPDFGIAGADAVEAEIRSHLS